ncbi:putative NAD(P)H dehydrogenase (quinone) FQR1-like 1, partial [Drosera capensis]
CIPVALLRRKLWSGGNATCLADQLADVLTKALPGHQQFKAFLDATGGFWRTQQLAGKPAGIFYATGSQGGGQETTPLIYVPICYTFGAGMFAAVSFIISPLHRHNLYTTE